MKEKLIELLAVLLAFFATIGAGGLIILYFTWPLLVVAAAIKVLFF
tara:strand:+ start:196 stop:333 length:138 start_codon:yes stop_codon:yes gene_type:complete